MLEIQAKYLFNLADLQVCELRDIQKAVNWNKMYWNRAICSTIHRIFCHPKYMQSNLQYQCNSHSP